MTKTRKPTSAKSDRVEMYRPAGWLSGPQTAERLGKSLTQVKKLVCRGYLHPVLKNAMAYYAASEVEALAAPGPRPAPWLASPPRRGKKKPVTAPARLRTRGQEAALVFRLLRAGKTIPEIVMRGRVPPDRARALYREWRLSLDTGEPTPKQTAAALARFDQLPAPSIVPEPGAPSTAGRLKASDLESSDDDNFELLAAAAERIFRSRKPAGARKR